MRAVLYLGVVYCGAGIVFGTLAGQAALPQARGVWRFAAWAVSAIAFGAHIIYEQLRLRSSPRITAVHVSMAAGLGAFGLAVTANVHALTVSPRPHSPLLALSLVIWPVITALPAFVVVLVVAMVLVRVSRNVQRGGAVHDYRRS